METSPAKELGSSGIQRCGKAVIGWGIDRSDQRASILVARHMATSGMHYGWPGAELQATEQIDAQPSRHPIEITELSIAPVRLVYGQ